MSKCRPNPTATLLGLEPLGVQMSDVTEVVAERVARKVVISIPYESLRDEKAVQLAFQDLVTISTTP